MRVVAVPRFFVRSNYAPFIILIIVLRLLLKKDVVAVVPYVVEK